MADDADIAGELVELFTDHNVASVRSQVAGAGQDYCEDCGEDIPPQRREVAPWAIRCVPCAELHERKGVHLR